MSATKTRIKEDAISVRGSRELPPDQDENTRCSATLRTNPRAKPMPRVINAPSTIFAPTANASFTPVNPN